MLVGEKMLRIEHLTKTFGEKKAVDDLSLHIAPGEIYGFIGHNGAGKTTTLKSVVGIQQFDSGEIYIGGVSIKLDPLACKKQLAYIPDNPDLYDYMSGIKYLNFVADIFGVSADARQERIRRYADIFELTDDLAQPIAAYSHGMKQKLAIIFFSTHVLEVAEKLCDKVAIIKSGKLIRAGTMEEVKGDDSLEEVFLELEDTSC